MDKEIRDKYFGNNWKPDYSQYKYSGWALLDKVKETDSIIDIGCGFNLFKPHWGRQSIWN